jgi:hypothetical protein
LYENTCRKDMTPSELVALGKTLEALERPKARERESQGGKGGLERCDQLNTPSRVRPIIAEALGVGETTYYRAGKVVEASESEDEEVRAVGKAAREQMDATGAVNPAYGAVREKMAVGKATVPVVSVNEPPAGPAGFLQSLALHRGGSLPR